MDGVKPRSPQTLKQAASLAWVREQDFFYLRNNLLRSQSSILSPPTAILLFAACAATQGRLCMFEFRLAGQSENMDFVPQVGLICALTTLNPTESFQ